MSEQVSSWSKPRSEAVLVAIQKLSGELLRYRQGVISEEEFRPNRTVVGAYGQRQPEQYMVRMRLPYGEITARQLRALADVARVYGNGTGHITTRQAIQIHWLPLDEIPGIFEQLSEAGITSLQAGGNSVRNVVSCPLAGVCTNESFDVTRYAAAVDERYVGNPLAQNLPRKFKSSFSGCARDCGLSAIQDFGAVAVQREENGHTVDGFQVYVGGGLGSMPRSGPLLDAFVPAAELLPTYEAVVRVFDRLGNRKKKDRARLKFVVSGLGPQEFHRLVAEERDALRKEDASFPSLAPGQEQATAMGQGQDGPEAAPSSPAYATWLRWNTRGQRQNGLHHVAVPLPLGDISSEQMEAVASIAERFPRVTLRTSVQQNLHVRGLTESALPAVYETLSAAGLTSLKVEGIADVTSCPGTSACSLAIAASKGLARQLQAMVLEKGYQDDEALAGLRIKLSGCPDACGQHLLADIGFCAAAQHHDANLYPSQTLFLGGRAQGAQTTLAQAVMRLPSRRVPDAVDRILTFYKEDRRPDERFDDFVGRVGLSAIRSLLTDLTAVGSIDEDPSLYIDWDSTRMYVLERGEGECSV